jgi:2,3-bisphosphoglycerate-independent phosphoglycerate mutase
MADFTLMRTLHQPADTKMVLLVMDGVGGLSVEPGGPTELEAASTPNLDRLATEGTLGQTIPVRPGITPGSGPGHLALFGYDPISYDVGRGVIEASGVGMNVGKGDVAARGNFCTIDGDGKITDRRAGRISSEEARPLVERLDAIELPDVQIDVRVLREYRFGLVLRGENLAPQIHDTDPLETGLAPLDAVASEPGAEHTADIVNRWVVEARKALADQDRANALTLRGFSSNPHLPQFDEIYGLDAACVAVYPMYKGVAHLVGMDVHAFDGEAPKDEFAAASSIWSAHDFFFIHIKKTDSLGEDGAFDKKAAMIETVDSALPSLLDLGPDVLAITGDHSTPARMKYHSWHPVPLLLWAPATARQDGQTSFGETVCARGGLGTFQASNLMPLMMAHAGRLSKYGA